MAYVRAEETLKPHGHGWLATVLASCFLGLIAGYSSTYFYTSGLFLIPVAADLNVSRGQASLGALFCALASATATPFFGRLLDRIGALSVAVLSLAGLSVGFLIVAYATSSLTTYILASIVLALLGSGSTALSFSRLVFAAFERSRGLALGFVMTGTGFGALVLPRLLMPIIQSQGWRAAYIWLASITFIAAIIVGAALYPLRHRLRPMPSRQPQADRAAGAPTRQAAWASSSFRRIGAVSFLLAIASVSLVVHFVPILIGAGVAGVSAAGIAGLIGLASIGSRLAMGPLLDRYPVKRLAALISAIAIVSTCLMLLNPATLGIAAALLLGTVMGCEADLLAFFAVRYFSERIYGAVYGGIFSLYLVGGAIGPSITAYLYDGTGGYRLPLLAIASSFAVALFAILRLPDPSVIAD